MVYYLHLVDCMVNVGKYTIYMDPMGWGFLVLHLHLWFSTFTFGSLIQVMFLHGYPFDHTNERMLDDVLRCEILRDWDLGSMKFQYLPRPQMPPPQEIWPY